MRTRTENPKMLRAARCVIVAILPVLVNGQVTNNSVTVTASQSITAQPDQAIFSVVVSSGFDKNLSDIVGAVQSAGITAANFAGLSVAQGVLLKGALPPNPQTAVQWNFQLLVPIAKMKDTTTVLAGLAQTIPQNGSGLSLAFTVVGTQVSSQQTASCSLPDLLTQARTQAQQLTNAAGLTVGVIQGITASTPGTCFVTVRFAVGGAPAPGPLNSITVSASRIIPVQPDEVSLQLNVTSDVNSGPDDITTALQQAGIAGATFTGVNTNVIYDPSAASRQSQINWSFTLTTPLAKLKDTFTALLSAQQALAKATPAFGMAFFGGGTLVSAQLQQSLTCPEADLLNDARSAAQKVAAAAGVSAGPVFSLSGGKVPTLSLVPGYRLGDFSAGSGGAILGGVITNTAPNVQQSCSMTVGFVLVQ